ncbi:hypothetical protein [Arthrobacter sp. VKM Ac-2550]|uniref:hypothetical protein n=1 Tax=Crystallibacter permensis TaxID=1938888 RepID=UPI002225F8F1|nr:hypothetical protein [Arthrobacter sp. VKM Ac-2550]MCW2134191.1 hypothetical protein [Arthrobacter sp. VKM Ac-2550]
MISTITGRTARSSSAMLLTVLGLAAVIMGILGMHVMPGAHGSLVPGATTAHVTAATQPLSGTDTLPSAAAQSPAAIAVPHVEDAAVGATETAFPAIFLDEGGNEPAMAAICLLALALLGMAILLVLSTLGRLAVTHPAAVLPGPHGNFPLIRPPSLVQLSISRT